jgi:hypothetical protein
MLAGRQQPLLWRLWWWGLLRWGRQEEQQQQQQWGRWQGGPQQQLCL